MKSIAVVLGLVLVAVTKGVYPTNTEDQADTVDRTDPWDRSQVARKFSDKFIRGTNSYYTFTGSAGVRGTASRGGVRGTVSRGGVRGTVSRAGVRGTVSRRGVPFTVSRGGVRTPISRPVVRGTVRGAGEHRTLRVRGPVSRAGGGDNGLTLKPRDLLFIIDMSGSINRQEWTTTKQKLADIIEKLCGTIGYSNQHNRIAIVTFSTRVVLNFDFKTHWTVASVRQAILNMPQDRGTTCTGDAVFYAHKYMFEPNTGIRSATASVKEVLVLTDGTSNCGVGLAANAEILKIKASVFTLAIGEFSERGKAEIESMVSRPYIDHIFSLANFLEFREMIDAVISYPSQCAPFELS